MIEIGRGYDKTVEGLLSALNDKSMLVRRSSAEALGNIGGELAVEGLLSALNDEYRYVRISAAEALGNIGSELAVERLK
ncbi:HEAT repeat domain-containing protein [Cyanothece sp. BG0011]|uniref:HEAT repeat domain-containing protein n=1 Tax=Cyanothece sp. BG0011 TaxID=2082950 RepID=UPI001300A592|nr:HEAT repeat domain-containing protein [Cyanothece sp. BG0011]